MCCINKKTADNGREGSERKRESGEVHMQSVDRNVFTFSSVHSLMAKRKRFSAWEESERYAGSCFVRVIVSFVWDHNNLLSYSKSRFLFTSSHWQTSTFCYHTSSRELPSRKNHCNQLDENRPTELFYELFEVHCHRLLFASNISDLSFRSIGKHVDGCVEVKRAEKCLTFSFRSGEAPAVWWGGYEEVMVGIGNM